MDLLNINIFIALVLMKNRESFRDSYSLTRVLSWVFGIIEVADIVAELTNRELIEVINKEPNRRYEVTEKGREYIKTHENEGRSLLLQNYPEEQEFINAIFE